MPAWKSLPFLGLLALFAAWNATTACANELVLTDCDTLQAVPPRMQVKFYAINFGPFPVCAIRVHPIPAFQYPACPILQASSTNPDWECVLEPSGDALLRRTAEATSCMAQWEVVESFVFAIEPGGACHYRVEYLGSEGQVVHSNVAFFECGTPVPTRPTTWGSVKARYH